MISNSSSVRRLGVNILTRVADKNSYADKLIEETFRRHRLKATDKNLLLELVNGTLRWRGYLDSILIKLYHGDFSESPTLLKSILEISLYQLIYLDRVPPYAAVSEAVNLARHTGGAKWASLVNGVLRSYLRQQTSFKNKKNNAVNADELAIRYSHPKWITERWLEQFGLEKAKKYCEYNNTRPQVSARVVGTSEKREKVLSELIKKGYKIKRSEIFDDFVKIQKGPVIFDDECFKGGFVNIQDESTAIATHLLAPKPGELTLDMCAAPGGKTCHLASLLRDKDLVIAIDSSKARLATLTDNIGRLKIKNVQAVYADSTKLPVRSADKILIDAPCSGLGVLGRRADLRWQRQLADIEKITQIQARLLREAARIITDRGAIVYSTCTLEPEETSILITRFLDENRHFRIDTSQPDFPLTCFKTHDSYYTSVPHDHGMDGSFAVRLITT